MIREMSKISVDEDCCFYFNSKCTKSNCRYRHSTSALNSSTVCKYWIQKRCLRAEDCPYRHSSAEQIKKSEQNAIHNQSNNMVISYMPNFSKLIGASNLMPQIAYNYANKLVSSVPNNNLVYGQQTAINSPTIDQWYKRVNLANQCCDSCVNSCQNAYIECSDSCKSIANDPILNYEYEKLYGNGVDIEQTPIGGGQRSVIHKGYLLMNRQLDKWHEIAIKRSYVTRHSLAECEAIRVLGRDRPHKNIIQYFGYNIIDNRLYIHVERSDLGDLCSYMASECAQRPPTEEDIFHLFRQIRDGLQHMHDCCFAHRDINSGNILVFQKPYAYSDPIGGNKVICKLCDFGSSRRYASDGHEMADSLAAPKFLSPEICETRSNVFAGDVYALGVLLYQMCHNGKHPFYLPSTDENLSHQQIWKQYALIKSKMETVQWSPGISRELLDLLREMLEPDPNKRITLKGIYDSEWIQVLVSRCKFY